MSRALRLAALAAFLLGLSGCNLVVSDEPWFTASDAVPAPVLRDGLWAAAAPDCRFTESKPAERWPDCANATFVRGDERWTMRWEDTDAPGKKRRTFAGWKPDESNPLGELLVANGDHLIGQNRNGGGELVPSDDPGEIAESEESSGGYFYFALRPVRHDEEGKVLELAIWLVACGPLPEAARPRSPGRGKGGDADEPSVTDHPFPGLEVAESNCVAENVEALRGAAVLSEHLGDPLSFHWVRDGWR